MTQPSGYIFPVLAGDYLTARLTIPRVVLRLADQPDFVVIQDMTPCGSDLM